MRKKPAGTVRIIGGKWRGSRLPVRDIPGLRPSGDRSRETLFNWLQVHIHGASCVDLFAGSGALGLEAASRGASRVVLVEKSKPAAEDIRESVSRLKAVGVEVVQGDAMDWLAGCEPESLDIVFIDPPFGTGLEARALELLKAANCLRVNGVVYVETARESTFAVPGTGWEIEKEKLLGDVCMRLLKKN